MACIDQYIHAPIIHGDRHHACRLARVQDKCRIGLFDQLADCCRVLKGSSNVRSMIYDNNPCVRLDAFRDLIWVYKTIGVSADTCDRNIVISLKMVGWPQYAVMLHSCNDHVIAWIQHARQHRIHGVSCVLRKRHACRVSSKPKELTQHATSLNNHGFSFDGQFVSRSPRVDTVAPEKLIHELIDRFGLGQGGCRIIKVIVIFHGSSFP